MHSVFKSQLFERSAFLILIKSLALTAVVNLLRNLIEFVKFINAGRAQTDRESAVGAADSGSNPGRVKAKTLKIGIYSFPVWRLAVNGQW